MKMAKNWLEMATYYAAYFLPHYRRALFSHLLVFNLWKLVEYLTKPVQIDLTWIYLLNLSKLVQKYPNLLNFS